jgi:hypothetical protein
MSDRRTKPCTLYHRRHSWQTLTIAENFSFFPISTTCRKAQTNKHLRKGDQKTVKKCRIFRNSREPFSRFKGLIHSAVERFGSAQTAIRGARSTKLTPVAGFTPPKKRIFHSRFLETAATAGGITMQAFNRNPKQLANTYAGLKASQVVELLDAHRDHSSPLDRGVRRVSKCSGSRFFSLKSKTGIRFRKRFGRSGAKSWPLTFGMTAGIQSLAVGDDLMLAPLWALLALNPATSG